MKQKRKSFKNNLITLCSLLQYFLLTHTKREREKLFNIFTKQKRKEHRKRNRINK